MKSKYSHLFSPLKVGGLTYKNRIEVSPTSMINFTEKEYVPRGWIEYYERLAAGGAAVVTIGETPVISDGGMTHAHMLQIDNPDSAVSLAKVADAIHRHEAYASIELCHGGAASARKFNHGLQAQGPSAGVCPFDGEEVSEMSEKEIEKVIEAFGDAAKQAKMCGIDQCMIHAGHGWLLAQFLSPLNNKRTDRWGGSYDNRIRIVIEVIRNIKKKCGMDFPVEVRISGTENCEGGYTQEDGVEFCRRLDGIADLVHISFGTIQKPGIGGGSTLCTPSPYEKRGRNVYLAANIKKHMKKTHVVTVGSIVRPDQMEEILAGGQADMVAAARTFLADPDFPKKAEAGEEMKIRPCLRCASCLDDDRCIPHIIHCAVNAEVGREEDYYWHPIVPKHEKRVLVIGGGPSGMQAALIAAERGHQVILCEKTGELGGALKYNRNISFKNDLDDYRRWIVDTVMSSKVNVLLNKEIDDEYVEKLNPDFTICAVGAEPVIPKIKGIDGENVVIATELHQEQGQMDYSNKKIIVIGGGLIGCESAIWLATQGAEVTLVEKADKIIPGETPVPSDGGKSNLREYTETNLQRWKVKVELFTDVIEIQNDSVCITDKQGNHTECKADLVVVAVGMKPLADLREGIRGACSNFMPIGDCNKVGRIKQAVAAGYAAGFYID